MNRWDEVAEAAHALASKMSPVADTQAEIAEGLINLSTLIVKAFGKCVAVDGEASLGLDDETAYARYKVGESFVDQADYVRGNVQFALRERTADSPVGETYDPDDASWHGIGAPSRITAAQVGCCRPRGFECPGVCVTVSGCCIPLGDVCPTHH